MILRALNCTRGMRHVDYVEKAVLQEDHNSRKECTYNNNIIIIN